MTLDQIVQLHEAIHIFYSVCPKYTAVLLIRDEAERILEATGNTPQDALYKLNLKADREISERWWKK